MTPPVRTNGPASNWPHRKLYERVVDALHALPPRFRTGLKIAGISATDLFTLNTPLGAAIEQSVVDNLNSLRELWDPEEEYQLYSFVRQAQIFPDVRLETNAPNVAPSDRVLMGIELKGWFVLSKEGEPSFRYKASPNACAMQDLLVVYPWRLSEVISGSPTLMRPFVEEAKYAAEHRNYYWQHLRGVTEEAGAVRLANVTSSYPNKGDTFNDEAVHDQGKNFGRVARGNLMTDFITALLQEQMSGIPARHWQTFLKIFSEGVSEEVLDRRLENLRRDVGTSETGEIESAFARIEEGLRTLMFPQAD